MWYVNTSSCANSSKLFEPYDYETFRKIQSQYATEIFLSFLSPLFHRGNTRPSP